MRGSTVSLRWASDQATGLSSITSSSMPIVYGPSSWGPHHVAHSGDSPRLHHASSSAAARLGAPAGGDESLEQRRLGAALDQQLGVPLHADTEVATRRLDALDRPVLGEGDRPQAVAELFDPLVVEGVDLQRLGSEQLGQVAVGVDLNRVARLLSGGALAVLDPVLEVGEVLHEGAAADDVQRLCAAADRQYRHLAGVGAARYSELEAVEVGLDRPQLRVLAGAVALRVEVGPAGEADPADAVEQRVIARPCSGGITTGMPPANSIARM